MKKLYTFILASFFVVIFYHAVDGQTQLAAWTFDTTHASPNTPTSVVANLGLQSGAATLYADGTNGSSSWNQATELGAFAGTTTNDPRTTQVSGNSFCLVDSSANGKSIILKFSMTAHKNLVLTFATRGTSTGFNIHQWAWSTDGTNFTDFGTNTAVNTSSWQIQTIDLSSVTQVNNASVVYLRNTFTGATSVSGNNRLDNIILSADTLIVSNVPSVTIAEARKDDDNNLIPDHSVTGDTLMITGVLTSSRLSGSTATYFVQDATGGIEIFHTGSPTTTYSMGDSVFVIGTVIQYHGLDEIEPLALDTLHFGIIKHNAVMPKAKKITLHQYVTNGEKYEGTLIEIDSLNKASGTWPVSSGGSGTIYLTNRSKADTTQMYINAATNIGGTTEPAYPVNVVAIGSQYSAGSTLNSGYEILPRDSNDIKSTPQVPLVTIAEARKDDDNNLIPDHSVTGDTLMITGVITSPHLTASYTEWFVQDATAGIEIYNPALPKATISIGDSVFVIGTIAQFHGLDEIEPLAIDTLHFGVLKHNVKVPAPKEITLHQYVANSESYEGELVEIDTLYKASGTWASGNDIYLTNTSKTDTVAMFINGATTLANALEPKYPINVVAIGNQFSSSPTVVNDGYELLPRDTSDIKSIVITGIKDKNLLPDNFELSQNYPNPFNPTTTIQYALPKAANVTLKIYDMLGREVRMLVSGNMNAGYHVIEWDGLNSSGAQVASGMYIYRINAGNFVSAKKMLMLK
jgi:DNA/RNA endonuclease YhcR with UshA esterase domain